MTRFPFKYVAGLAAILLLGGVMVAASSEQVRCALAQSCGAVTSVMPPEEAAPVATTTIPIATTTATVATTTVATSIVTEKPVVTEPVAPAKPAPAPPATPPAPVTTVTTTTTAPTTAEEGPTTFSVSAVPLLVGGNVRAGESVPISYLQVVNRGSNAARLTGFWVKQNGNAPTEAVIGLSTVDDKGGSRRQTGGTEGSTPFRDGAALAPTDAMFQPGQMRLFTIKAIMSSDISAHIGTQLKIDVTALQAQDVTFTGAFPIRGTTWTLSP